MKSHNILTIPMGDYEEPIVLNNGEDAKTFVESIINATTYSRRWRGRGKRKVHAIADGYSARGYDQDLPLEFAERQVLYVDVRPPTKKQKEERRIKDADYLIQRCRNTAQWHLNNNAKTEEELKRGEAELNLAREELKEAIQNRNKITATVREV